MAAAFSAPATHLGRVGATGKMPAEAPALPGSLEHSDAAADQEAGAWSLIGQRSGVFEGLSSSMPDTQDMTDEGANVLLSLAAPRFSRSGVTEWPEATTIDTITVQQEGEGEARSREHEAASVAGAIVQAESFAEKRIKGQETDCKVGQSSRVGAAAHVSTQSEAAGSWPHEAEEKPVAPAGHEGQESERLVPEDAQAGKTLGGVPLLEGTEGAHLAQEHLKAQAGKTQGSISSLESMEGAHPGQPSLKGCKRSRNTPRQQRRFEGRSFIFSDLTFPRPHSQNLKDMAATGSAKNTKSSMQAIPRNRPQAREGREEGGLKRVGLQRTAQVFDEKGEDAVRQNAGKGGTFQADQTGVPGRGKRGGRGSRHSQHSSKRGELNGLLRRDEAQSGVEGGAGSEEDSVAAGKGLRAREASFRGWLENTPGSGANEASSQVLARKDLGEEFSLAGGLRPLGVQDGEKAGEAGLGFAAMRAAASRLTDLDSVASSLEDACERGELSADRAPRDDDPVPYALNRLSQAAAVAAAVEDESNPESELGLFTPEMQGAPRTLHRLRQAMHEGSPGASDQVPGCVPGACAGGEEKPAKRPRQSPPAAAAQMAGVALAREPSDPACAPVTPDLGPLNGATVLFALCSTGSTSQKMTSGQGPCLMERGPAHPLTRAHGTGSWPDSQLSSAREWEAEAAPHEGLRGGGAGDGLHFGGAVKGMKDCVAANGTRAGGDRDAPGGFLQRAQACAAGNLTRRGAPTSEEEEGPLAMADLPTEGSEVSQDLGGQGGFCNEDVPEEEQGDLSNKNLVFLEVKGAGALGGLGGEESTEQAAIMSLLSVSADPPSCRPSEALAPAFSEPAYRPYILLGQSNHGGDLYSSRESSIANHQEGRLEPGSLEEEQRQTVAKRKSRPQDSTHPVQGPFQGAENGHAGEFEGQGQEDRGGEEETASGEELQELYALLKGLCRTGRKSAAATSSAAADSAVSASGSRSPAETEGQQQKQQKGAGARGGRRKRGSAGRGGRRPGAAAAAPHKHSLDCQPRTHPSPKPSFPTSTSFPPAENASVTEREAGSATTSARPLPGSNPEVHACSDVKLLPSRSATVGTDIDLQAEAGIPRHCKPLERDGKEWEPVDEPDKKALGTCAASDRSLTPFPEKPDVIVGESDAVQASAQLQPRPDCIVLALAQAQQVWDQETSDCMEHEEPALGGSTNAAASVGGERAAAGAAEGEGGDIAPAAPAAGGEEGEGKEESEPDVAPAQVPWDLNSLQYRKRRREGRAALLHLTDSQVDPHPHPQASLSLPDPPQDACGLTAPSLAPSELHLLPAESLLLLTDSADEPDVALALSQDQEGVTSSQEGATRSQEGAEGGTSSDDPTACPHCGDSSAGLGWARPLPGLAPCAPWGSPLSGTWPGLPIPPTRSLPGTLTPTVHSDPGMTFPSGMPFLAGMPFPSRMRFPPGMLFPPGFLSGACNGIQGAPSLQPVPAPVSGPCSQHCSSSHGGLKGGGGGCDPGLTPAQQGVCPGQPGCAPPLPSCTPCPSSLGTTGQESWPLGVPAAHQSFAMGALWALSTVSSGGPFPMPLPCFPSATGADAAAGTGAGAHWICCPSCKIVCTSNDLCWDAHMGLDMGVCPAQPQKATAASWEVEPLGAHPEGETGAARGDGSAVEASRNCADSDGGNGGGSTKRVKGPRTKAAAQEEGEEEDDEEECPCQLGGWGRVEFWWRPGSPRACPDWRTHRPSGGVPDASALSSRATVYVRRVVWDASRGRKGKRGPPLPARAAPRFQGRPFSQAHLAHPLPQTPDPVEANSSAQGKPGQGHKDHPSSEVAVPGKGSAAQGSASTARGKAKTLQGKATSAQAKSTAPQAKATTAKGKATTAQGKAAAGSSTRGPGAAKPASVAARKGQRSGPAPRGGAAPVQGRAAKGHSARKGTGTGGNQAKKTSAGSTGSGSGAGGQRGKAPARR